MKSLLGSIKFKKNSSVAGFQFLNEKEMQSIRGGVEPTKPKSRPKEIYDFEEE